MTIKNDIVKLLNKRELTSIQISSELQIHKDKLWGYLSKLVKEDKIEKTTDKKPFKYRATKTYNENMNNRLLHDKIDKLENEKKELKQHIIFLNNFFKDNIDFLMKNEAISNFVLNNEEFDKIEELSK